MSARLEELWPRTREKCALLLTKAHEAGLIVRVTHTLRSNDEQDHLYAKGRTIAGEPCWHGRSSRAVGTCPVHPLGAKVTNARAGQSPHNEIVDGLAVAFDVCFAGKDPYLSEYPKSNGGRFDPKWLELGQLGESLGLSWGGPLGTGDRFTFDMPHFEEPGWKSLRTGPSEGPA